jgi:hypothetical protein
LWTTWHHITCCVICSMQGRRVLLENNGCTQNVCGRIGATDSVSDGGEPEESAVRVRLESEAAERKTESDSGSALQPRFNERKSKKPVLELSSSDSSSSEEELEVRAVKVCLEHWINLPHRVFVGKLGTGPREPIVAEDRDEPVEEPAEQNPFYTEVKKAWRRNHHVPARPQPKAVPKWRKRK